MLKYHKNRKCNCGCNGRILIKRWHKYSGIPRFINGHQCRGKHNPMAGVMSPMLNKHHTKETKEKQRLAKLGSKNPFYNKKHSRSTLRKLRLCSLGASNSFFHKHHTVESKKLMQERHADVSGNKNPNWRGGIAYFPYAAEFNNKLKAQIRERDGRICRQCKMSEHELGYKLSIHHKDYNKQNNDPDNLISLCRTCHAQTNFNRSDWTKYFNAMQLLK